MKKWFHGTSSFCCYTKGIYEKRREMRFHQMWDKISCVIVSVSAFLKPSL